MLSAMEGSKRAPDRDLLLSQHEFPGEYMVKAFGPSGDAFATAVHAAATSVVGGRFASRTRDSTRGQKICVTLELQAETVDEVIAVYERLHAIDSLLLIL